MLEKSEEKIEIKKRKTTFLNVGRHEEISKNLSMLFRCVKKLLDEK